MKGVKNCTEQIQKFKKSDNFCYPKFGRTISTYMGLGSNSEKTNFKLFVVTNIFFVECIYMPLKLNRPF